VFNFTYGYYNVGRHNYSWYVYDDSGNGHTCYTALYVLPCPLVTWNVVQTADSLKITWTIAPPWYNTLPWVYYVRVNDGGYDDIYRTAVKGMNLAWTGFYNLRVKTNCDPAGCCN